MKAFYRKRNTAPASHTKKTKGIKKTFAVCCFFVAAFVAVVFVLNKSVLPLMQQLAEAKVKALANAAMSDAILVSLSAEETYASLVESSDNGEKMYMLKTNPSAMNMLSVECSSAAQKKLAEAGELGISISVGTLTGISFLSGKGANINVHFTPSSSVKASFLSTLETSGINQTLYKVKIVLTADLYIVLPGIAHSVSASAEAAIAEAVIIGDVPQVYTNVPEGSLDNFIPTDIP